MTISFIRACTDGFSHITWQRDTTFINHQAKSWVFRGWIWVLGELYDPPWPSRITLRQSRNQYTTFCRIWWGVIGSERSSMASLIKDYNKMGSSSRKNTVTRQECGEALVSPDVLVHPCKAPGKARRGTSASLDNPWNSACIKRQGPGTETHATEALTSVTLSRVRRESGQGSRGSHYLKRHRCHSRRRAQCLPSEQR